MHVNKSPDLCRFGFTIAIASLVVCPAIQAATISDLYNTGVDNAGAALVGAGVPDPHYSIVIPGAATPVTVDDTNFPIPPWLANNANSRWISPTADSIAAAGNYRYRTTFTVPANAILSTVNVSGLWATDDPGLDIRINGASTGQTSSSFSGLTPFNVNSGFVFGTNVLEFDVLNSPLAGSLNPTGLRVDRIIGSYEIPEPAAAALACAGLAVLAVLLRPRSARFAEAPHTGDPRRTNACGSEPKGGRT